MLLKLNTNMIHLSTCKSILSVHYTTSKIKIFDKITYHRFQQIVQNLIIMICTTLNLAKLKLKQTKITKTITKNRNKAQYFNSSIKQFRNFIPHDYV